MAIMLEPAGRYGLPAGHFGVRVVMLERHLRGGRYDEDAGDISGSFMMLCIPLASVGGTVETLRTDPVYDQMSWTMIHDPSDKIVYHVCVSLPNPLVLQCH